MVPLVKTCFKALQLNFFSFSYSFTIFNCIECKEEYFLNLFCKHHLAEFNRQICYVTLSKRSSKWSKGNVNVLLPYAETKVEWCHLVNKQNTFNFWNVPFFPCYLPISKNKQKQLVNSILINNAKPSISNCCYFHYFGLWFLHQWFLILQMRSPGV